MQDGYPGGYDARAVHDHENRLCAHATNLKPTFCICLENGCSLAVVESTRTTASIKVQGALSTGWEGRGRRPAHQMANQLAQACFPPHRVASSRLYDLVFCGGFGILLVSTYDESSDRLRRLDVQRFRRHKHLVQFGLDKK